MFWPKSTTNMPGLGCVTLSAGRTEICLMGSKSWYASSAVLAESVEAEKAGSHEDESKPAVDHPGSSMVAL